MLSNLQYGGNEKMNRDRLTQKRVFRAFRRAHLTGRMARYLQFLYVEYCELKEKRSNKAKKFCAYYEQAERIYKNYKNKELLVATATEKHDFEVEANRLRAIGSRNFATGITRARA